MTEIEPAPGALITLRPDTAAVAYTDLDYSITTETAGELLAAVPENTRRAYERAWGAFEDWCAGESRVALPATPHTLTEYIRRLCGAGLSPNTVSQAIGVIRARHRDAGFPKQPDTRQTARLLRSYRRAWSDSGGRVRQRTPLLVPALRAMIQACDPGTAAGTRDRAILLLGFNIMGRRSELSRLDLADVASAGEEGVTVFIRYSKTDQEAKGVSVPVPYGQHAPTCAVRALRAWTGLLAERGVTAGALFRPVDRHGHIGDEDGAAGHPQERLTGHAINEMVRRRALLAGLKDYGKYGAHSLRSGAATTAYAHGVPVAEIAKHGRWNPKSPVILGYIRAVDDWDNNPMKGIGL
jgi:integrase